MRVIALSLALAGCTTMSHEHIDGWPALTVVEHRVPHAEMVERCAPYIKGGYPVACAHWNFKLARCDIYYSNALPDMQHVIAHERMHCAGFDHPGSTSMRDSLTKWRAQ